MVDIFTKEQFERALPVSRKASISPMIPASIDTKLWKPLGLMGTEYAYIVPVTEKGCDIGIMIRSSVRPDGRSAGVGEDSIRCWLVSMTDYKPWGSKVSKYITRVSGWEKRLTVTLKQLYKMALSIQRCPHCQKWMKAFKVKKEGPNHGRIFLKCNCGRGCNEPPKFMEIS
jgi:hypothetical protein